MKNKTPQQKARVYYRFARQKIKRNPDNILWHAFFVLVVVFLFIMLVPFGSELIGWLVGTETKKETLEFIGVGIGGVIALLGALAFNRRANEMARQNTLTEKGHINERFKSAVESLASGETAARIASFYQFYYLAKDSLNFDFRKNIFDILCAHLRHITGAKEYEGKETPTAEVQSLLDLLFKSKDKIFADMKINLMGVCLVNADLRHANLQGADLTNADLRQANMYFANFQGARLWNAEFQRALLCHANMRGADLEGVNFIGEKFQDAKIEKIEWDKHTKFPRGIIFTDKDDKKYKTDKNGKPQEITEGE